MFTTMNKNDIFFASVRSHLQIHWISNPEERKDKYDLFYVHILNVFIRCNDLLKIR